MTIGDWLTLADLGAVMLSVALAAFWQGRYRELQRFHRRAMDDWLVHQGVWMRANRALHNRIADLEQAHGQETDEADQWRTDIPKPFRRAWDDE